MFESICREDYRPNGETATRRWSRGGLPYFGRVGILPKTGRTPDDAILSKCFTRRTKPGCVPLEQMASAGDGGCFRRRRQHRAQVDARRAQLPRRPRRIRAGQVESPPTAESAVPSLDHLGVYPSRVHRPVPQSHHDLQSRSPGLPLEPLAVISRQVIHVGADVW